MLSSRKSRRPSKLPVQDQDHEAVEIISTLPVTRRLDQAFEESANDVEVDRNIDPQQPIVWAGEYASTMTDNHNMHYPAQDYVKPSPVFPGSSHDPSSRTDASGKGKQGQQSTMSTRRSARHSVINETPSSALSHSLSSIHITSPQLNDRGVSQSEARRRPSSRHSIRTAEENEESITPMVRLCDILSPIPTYKVKLSQVASSKPRKSIPTLSSVDKPQPRASVATFQEPATEVEASPNEQPGGFTSMISSAFQAVKKSLTNQPTDDLDIFQTENSSINAPLTNPLRSTSRFRGQTLQGSDQSTTSAKPKAQKITIDQHHDRPISQHRSRTAVQQVSRPSSRADSLRPRRAMEKSSEENRENSSRPLSRLQTLRSARPLTRDKRQQIHNFDDEIVDLDHVDEPNKAENDGNSITSRMRSMSRDRHERLFLTSTASSSMKAKRNQTPTTTSRPSTATNSLTSKGRYGPSGAASGATSSTSMSSSSYVPQVAMKETKASLARSARTSTATMNAQIVPPVPVAHTTQVLPTVVVDFSHVESKVYTGLRPRTAQGGARVCDRLEKGTQMHEVNGLIDLTKDQHQHQHQHSHSHPHHSNQPQKQIRPISSASLNRPTPSGPSQSQTQRGTNPNGSLIPRVALLAASRLEKARETSSVGPASTVTSRPTSSMSTRASESKATKPQWQGSRTSQQLPYGSNSTNSTRSHRMSDGVTEIQTIDLAGGPSQIRSKTPRSNVQGNTMGMGNRPSTATMRPTTRESSNRPGTTEDVTTRPTTSQQRSRSQTMRRNQAALSSSVTPTDTTPTRRTRGMMEKNATREPSQSRSRIVNLASSVSPPLTEAKENNTKTSEIEDILLTPSKRQRQMDYVYSSAQTMQVQSETNETESSLRPGLRFRYIDDFKNRKQPSKSDMEEPTALRRSPRRSKISIDLSSQSGSGSGSERRPKTPIGNTMAPPVLQSTQARPVSRMQQTRPVSRAQPRTMTESRSTSSTMMNRPDSRMSAHPDSRMSTRPDSRMSSRSVSTTTSSTIRSTSRRRVAEDQHTDKTDKTKTSLKGVVLLPKRLPPKPLTVPMSPNITKTRKKVD